MSEGWLKKIPPSLRDKNLNENMPRMKGPRNYPGPQLGPLQGHGLGAEINQRKNKLPKVETRPQLSAALD